jgi:S1-C subfamily serine protease
VGDIITDVDAQPIERAHVLRWRVSTRGVGKLVEMVGRRHGRPFKVRVRLEPMEMPELAETASGAAGR